MAELSVCDGLLQPGGQDLNYDITVYIVLDGSAQSQDEFDVVAQLLSTRHAFVVWSAARLCLIVSDSTYSVWRTAHVNVHGLWGTPCQGPQSRLCTLFYYL